MKIDWKKILAVVGGFIILAGAAYAASFWKSEPYFPAPRICCGGVTSTVAGDVSEWKIFRNNSFQIEFKYPPRLSLRYSDAGVGLAPYPYADNTDQILNHLIFVRRFKEDNLSFSEFLHDDEDYNPADPSYYDEGWTKINGINVYKYKRLTTSGDVDVYSVFVKNDDVAIRAFYRLKYAGQENPHSSELERIISTLNFIKPEVVISKGWKAFKNDKLDYQVGYPSTHSITTTGENSVCFSSGASEEGKRFFCVDVFKKSPRVSLRDWWNDFEGSGDFVEKEWVEIDGTKALVFEAFVESSLRGSIPHRKEIIFEKGSKVFKIFINDESATERDVLLSFGFLVPEVTNNSGWKVYQSDKYGFEIKYPHDWEVLADFYGYFSIGPLGIPNYNYTLPMKGDMQVGITPNVSETPGISCKPSSYISMQIPPGGDFRKTLCVGDFMLTAAYFNHPSSDFPLTESQINQRKQILDTVINSFKVTGDYKK